MLKEHTLFRVTTHGCGQFYVVATSWSDAAATLTEALKEADYGYRADREILQIDCVAKEQFYNDKSVCYDDSRLVIDRTEL